MFIFGGVILWDSWGRNIFFWKFNFCPFQWGIAWYGTVNTSRDIIFLSCMVKNNFKLWRRQWVKLLCEWDIICKTLDGGLFCGTLALLAVKWFNVSVCGGSSNDIGAVTKNKKQSTNNWTTGHSLFLWGKHCLEVLSVLKVIIFSKIQLVV